MKTIKITALLISLLLSFQMFACKTCGCSSKKNTHSHSENSINKLNQENKAKNEVTGDDKDA